MLRLLVRANRLREARGRLTGITNLLRCGEHRTLNLLAISAREGCSFAHPTNPAGRTIAQNGPLTFQAQAKIGTVAFRNLFGLETACWRPRYSIANNKVFAPSPF
jgi:hypothetical protein